MDGFKELRGKQKHTNAEEKGLRADLVHGPQLQHGHSLHWINVELSRVNFEAVSRDQ